jgi:hypothetical protein
MHYFFDFLAITISLNLDAIKEGKPLKPVFNINKHKIYWRYYFIMTYKSTAVNGPCDATLRARSSTAKTRANGKGNSTGESSGSSSGNSKYFATRSPLFPSLPFPFSLSPLPCYLSPLPLLYLSLSLSLSLSIYPPSSPLPRLSSLSISLLLSLLYFPLFLYFTQGDHGVPIVMVPGSVEPIHVIIATELGISSKINLTLIY